MESFRLLMTTSHYPPYHIGGDAVLVKYLCEELARRGHEVHVLYNPHVYALLRKGAPDPPSDDIVHRHAYETSTGRIDAIAALGIGTWGRAAAQLNRLAKELRPDVVHWHNTKGFIGIPFAFDGIDTMYTAHDYYAVCPRSNLLRPNLTICERPEMCQVCLMRWRKPPELWRTGVRRVLRLDRRIGIISPSQYLARRLEADGLRKPMILKNFVPDRGFNITGDDERDTVTFLGVMDVHKGPSTLLDAFVASVSRQGFRLDMIGEGGIRGSIAQRVSRLGLGKRIRVHGFLPRKELDGVLDRTAALVVPSEWLENAPLVILEAFSMGIPVIGSNIGGIPELVGEQSGSLLFRAGDKQSLADALVTLWNRRTGLRQMRIKARRFYESEFSPDTHVSRYLELLEKDSSR